MAANGTKRSEHLRYKRTNPNGSESARPVRRGAPTLRDHIETVTKSGPVKTWAEMTPEQRQRVLAQLKPSGTR